MEKKKELTRYERQSRERISLLISDYCDGSQQRFCDKTGLNKASISQYVNGKNTPSNITAGKIAEVFNVDPAWLMGFDVPMLPASSTPDTISTELSRHESDLISAYRNASDDTRVAVCAVLGIKGDMQSSVDGFITA